MELVIDANDVKQNSRPMATSKTVLLGMAPPDDGWLAGDVMQLSTDEGEQAGARNARWLACAFHSMHWECVWTRQPAMADGRFACSVPGHDMPPFVRTTTCDCLTF